MLRIVIRTASHDDGQTAIEYALVMLTIALVLLLALAAGIGGSLDDFGDTFRSAMP